MPVHIERLNGVLRDRLACLTRKTLDAFAKSTSRWGALFWTSALGAQTGCGRTRRCASRAPYPAGDTTSGHAGYRIEGPPLVLARVPEHKGYCQLLRSHYQSLRNPTKLRT